MKSSSPNGAAALHVQWLVRNLSILALLTVAVLARAQAPAPVSSAGFARAASEHFTTQVEAARVAQTKSKDPRVKAFASRLESDYEQAARTLTSICEQLHIDVLPQRGTGQAVAGAASAAPESSFDQVYTLEVSQALAKATTSFDAALQSPSVDPKLKDFARQEMKTVSEYRKQVDPLARSQTGQSNR